MGIYIIDLNENSKETADGHIYNFGNFRKFRVSDGHIYLYICPSLSVVRWRSENSNCQASILRWIFCFRQQPNDFLMTDYMRCKTPLFQKYGLTTSTLLVLLFGQTIHNSEAYKLYMCLIRPNGF